jgi:predicted outer membrane repeat protein
MNTQMKTLMSQHIFNSSIRRILFATCLSALCLIAFSTQAATITVTNTNDSDAGSLRQALVDAVDGDTINFDSSLNGQTLTLTSGELLVNKSVTINGPGPNNLTVDGNHASRVFQVSGGVTATIAGLSITNGFVSSNFGAGGGIYNDHAVLTLSDCTISGNSATYGGGIFNEGFSGSATLILNNCTVSGNWGLVHPGIGSPGGGIYNHGVYGNATLTLNSCTFSSNSATSGGGIYTSSFSGNATLTVNNSTFSSNSAPFGGGIYNDGFSGNGIVSLNNSTFSANSATYGGGIYNDASSGSATLDLTNTILNAGTSGANIYNSNGGTVTSHGYNLSSDGGVTNVGGSGGLTATGDQINTDPLLGPLQDNGGPTFTHELLTGSPAIDAGDPNFTPPPAYDQRGSGYDRVLNGRIDIGAFEEQTVTPSYAAQIQPPINADGTSVFSSKRGVVPVKFTLTQGGVATCDLPPATIAVTRTGGGVTGQVNESVYSDNADTGSNFRIDNCQYVYNLNSRALGIGIYRVDILIDGQVLGSVTFELR